MIIERGSTTIESDGMTLVRCCIHIDENCYLQGMKLYRCTITCDFELNTDESKSERSEIYKKVFGNAVLEDCAIFRK